MHSLRWTRPHFLYHVAVQRPSGQHTLRRRATRLLVLFALWCGLIAVAAPTTPVQAQYSVTINTGATLTANGNFQGFGVQDDTNWMWLGNSASGAPVVPADYNNFIAPRLQAMKLPWVRKFIDIHWYEATQGTYTWNSNAMTGLYTDLQTLKNNGAKVLLTIWEIPTWMSNYTTGDGVSHNPVSYWPTTTTQDSEWAQAVTDLLKHLYGTDGSGYSFSNIRWVGGPNELGNQEQLSVSALDTPYSDLDSTLTAAGIRSNVTFFGPDMYFPGGDTDITAARQDGTLNPLLGLYDVHDYQNSQAPFDSDASAAINAASGSGKQVWLTEFGNGTFPGAEGTAIRWDLNAQWAIEALNRGYAAASLWTAGDQWYCGGAPCMTATPPTSDSGTLDGGKWGLWGYKDSSYAPRLSYYAYSNITAHTAANSKVYANSCGCANLGVAALNDQNGHDTVLVMNWNSSAEPVSFSYSGASPTETMYRYTINSSSQPSGNLESYDEALSMSNGSFSDMVPANSFVVYSSLNPVTCGVSNNLLQNCGFETGSLSPNWQVYSNYGPANAAYADNTANQQHTGGWSLAEWASVPYSVSAYQTVPGLSTGHTYTASAWVQSTGGQSLQQMSVYDAPGGNLLCRTTIPVTGVGAWQQVSCNATVDTTQQATVAFESNSPAYDYILVDDASFSAP